MSDRELREEQLRKQIERLQSELKLLEEIQTIQPVSWNEPLSSQPLEPRYQPLQPRSFSNIDR